MMSEIQPTRIRAKAVAITTTVIWTAGFVGPLFYPVMEEYSKKWLGSIAGIFVFYLLICCCALLFGWRLLPETRNKTLEEISQYWLKK